MSDVKEDFWPPPDLQQVDFFGSVLGGAVYLLLSLPGWLWHLYVEYLWHWDKHHWIISMAASLKLAAILIITPFAMLALLDVGAYVIARTLGVVETTRASTSDSKDSPGAFSDSDTSETDGTHIVSSPVQIDIVHTPETPIAEQDTVAAAPEADTRFAPSSLSRSRTTASRARSRFDLDSLAIPIPHASYPPFGKIKGSPDGAEPEACFFSPSDERQLELSGGLLSSPTPSRQASPGLERRPRAQSLNVHRLQTHDATLTVDGDANSTAESEPFTVLDPSRLNADVPESEGYDAALGAMANLRKRGTGHRDDGVS